MIARAVFGALVALALVAGWHGPVAAQETQQDTTAGTADTGASGALARIAERGEVRLGFRTDAPPFSALVEGRPAGFTVELCALVAAELREVTGLERMTARFLPVGTGQRFEAVATGEIDVLCGATTATLSRRETVDFSIQTFRTGVGAALRADAPDLLREVLLENSPAALSQAAVAEALRGRTLGVRRDTTAEDWLGQSGATDVEGVSVTPFETHDAGIEALAAGEIDAYFADIAILIGQVRAREDAGGFALSEKAFTQEPYALALPRGDSDFRLAVDRALSRLYRSGAVLQLVEKHFGRPGADIAGFYASAALPE